MIQAYVLFGHCNNKNAHYESFLVVYQNWQKKVHFHVFDRQKLKENICTYFWI